MQIRQRRAKGWSRKSHGCGVRLGIAIFHPWGTQNTLAGVLTESKLLLVRFFAHGPPSPTGWCPLERYLGGDPATRPIDRRILGPPINENRCDSVGFVTWEMDLGILARGGPSPSFPILPGDLHLRVVSGTRVPLQ